MSPVAQWFHCFWQLESCLAVCQNSTGLGHGTLHVEPVSPAACNALCWKKYRSRWDLAVDVKWLDASGYCGWHIEMHTRLGLIELWWQDPLGLVLCASQCTCAAHVGLMHLAT